MTIAYFEGKKYNTCKDLRKAVFEWCIEKDIILPSGSSIVNLWKHWKITKKYIDVLSRIDIVDDRGEFRPDRIRYVIDDKFFDNTSSLYRYIDFYHRRDIERVREENINMYLFNSRFDKSRMKLKNKVKVVFLPKTFCPKCRRKIFLGENVFHTDKMSNYCSYDCLPEGERYIQRTLRMEDLLYVPAVV
jgi:hypothetical protein